MSAERPAEGTDYLLGLELEHHLVRENIADYVARQAGESCKLAIGAGHIADPMALRPAYKPGGSNCLTESIQGAGIYTFHRHTGWYTFSAEMDAAFGSDMIGNIRKVSHQDAILPPNTWNLIWDESYHPAVLSAEHLFEKALASLKPEGVFVFTIPINKSEGVWITGNECDDVALTGEFSGKLAYAPLSEKFDSLEAVETFIRDHLKAISFSSVELHKSILMTALQNVTGQTSFKAVNESLVELLDSEIMRIITEERYQLLRLDPIFAHTGGMYYVVAKK